MILERLKVLLEGDTSGLSGAFGKLAAGITAGAIFNKIIDESTEAQFAMAQLEAVVESTGGAAGKTVGELDALSSALQQETLFSDEAVQSAEAMLLTFDRISGPTFDRATRNVLDFAQATGQDATSAARVLGRALNDPIQGLTALSRAGVQFSEAEEKVIKQLVETGHQAEAQDLILDQLERRFGGSAAAARDTLGGALQGLKNDFGELFEVSRESSGGIIDAINAMGDAIPFVRDAFNVLLQGVQRGGALAAVGIQELEIQWLKVQRLAALATFRKGAFHDLQEQIAAAERNLSFLKDAADETWDEVLTGGTSTRGRGAAASIASAAEQGERAALAFEAAEIPARGISLAFQNMAAVDFPAVLEPLPRAVDSMTALNDEAGRLASAGLDAIVGFATGATDAFGNFIDFALAEISRLIAKLVLVNALKAIFAGATGGIGGAILGALEGRAAGGPVSAGRPYIVGERGPELFVPASSGSVVANGAAALALPPLPRPMSPTEAASQAWFVEAVRLVMQNNGSR